MPRYDDDYDDRDDDRPRRRRKASGGGSGNTWLILGVIGGVILLVVAGCAGVVIWTVNKAGEGFNEMMAAVVAQSTAEQWMEDLKGGNTKLAYDATSTGFKSKQSQQQFEQFVARNPTLTKHTFRTPNFDPGQASDGKPIVIKYRLHTSDLGEDEWDEDDEEFRPKPKPPKVKGAKKGPSVPEIDVTITLVKEGGVWKVDAITIP
jgi:hypothetical protein